jgi:hypothetical protein
MVYVAEDVGVNDGALHADSVFHVACTAATKASCRARTQGE